jgi:hypothetical protein
MKYIPWSHSIEARPAAAFQPTPNPLPDFPWSVETELERLKSRLLKLALARVVTPALVPALRRAANEAAALAWLEPYPLLVFPTLFQEKSQTAQRQLFRQNLIRARSETLLAEAA